MNQEEYIKLFIAESTEMIQAMEESLMHLEKEPSHQATLNELFRITHTLKGNAMGMGYEEIASIAHVLEDFFSELKSGTPLPGSETFELLFRSVDTISRLVAAIETGEEVNYRGIRQKLKLTLEKARKAEAEAPAQNTESTTQEDTQSPSENTPETMPQDITAEEEQQEEDNTQSVQHAISEYIQVPTEKLDSLLDLIGELIIERDRLIARHKESYGHSYNRLNRISSDLQYSVMNIRLMQVGFLFKKFHRLVRDTATQEKKEVRLILEGTDVEVDRNILKVISDSLVHLIRNAIGHGIEGPEDREAAGKNASGNLRLEAAVENQGVRISISDDGKGMDIEKIRQQVIARGLVTAEMAKELPDQQIISYIFEPGFSTKEAVSGVSGRGVGMDVVKTALDQVGGQIEVDTQQGKGTTFHLYMPASMAVKSVMLFQLKQQVYAIQLAYTDSVTSLYKSEVMLVKNHLAFRTKDQVIPLYFLSDLFASRQTHLSEWNSRHPEDEFQVIVVQIRGRKAGLIVDKMLQQKEIVEKPLAKPVDYNEFVNGTTILGDGNICLVLNIPAIVADIMKRQLNMLHL